MRLQVPYRAAAVIAAATLLVSALAVLAAPDTGDLAHAEVTTPPADVWVTALNRFRAEYGVAPVTEDPDLSAAAEQHALYMAKAGAMTHVQDPDSPDYTAEGAAAAAASLLAGPAVESEPQQLVDLWSGGAFTTLRMLDPGLATVGYGQTAAGEDNFAALDVLSGLSADVTKGGWPRTWPSSAAPVRTVAYAGDERPSPVAPCGAEPAAGWGLPLLVSYGPGAQPTSVTASVTRDGGTAVPVCVTSAEDYGDPVAAKALRYANTVLVVPKEQLAAGSTYVGTVSSSRGKIPLGFTVAGDRVPDSPPVVIQPSEVTRLDGSNRYATSVRVAAARQPSATTIVVVSGADAARPDGLVAGTLAQAADGPILLTGTNALPSVVVDEVQRREATTAYLVGGPASVTPAVESQLRALGVDVTRVGGRNRYETAANVAREVARLRGGGPVTSALVASGEDRALADALGSAGPAGATGRVLLLVRRDVVPSATADVLKELGVRDVSIVGGPVSVGTTTETALKDAAPDGIRRLYGRNRYDTAAALATALADEVGVATVAVTSGEDSAMADAISAGALGHITVFAQRTQVPAVTDAWLTARKAAINEGLVIGGRMSVSDPALDQLRAAIE